MATAKKRGAGKSAKAPAKTQSSKTTKKPAKKASAPKTSKKTAAKKTSKKTAAKKTAAKKTAAKKTAAQKTSKKTAPKKTAAKKAAAKKAAAKPVKRSKRSRADITMADPSLFAPLTEGERADALRVLTEDKRLSSMAKVGRYQVIAVEPLVLKPPQKGAGSRLARIVIYDYAGDRCIDASVNLDASRVEHLGISRAQPMLARAEEATAISIAMTDKRVNAELSLGDEAQVAMHYWSPHDTDLAYTRRSAAVVFGRPGARPSLVAVVDLLDNMVAEIIPADQW